MDANVLEAEEVFNADDPFFPRADFGRYGNEDGTAGARIFWSVKHLAFEGGGGEVVAWRSNILKVAPGNALRSKSARGESTNRAGSVEASVRRARKSLRHRVASIHADRLLTLTYKENMQDQERLKADFDSFRRRMGKVGQWHYVAAIEKQERGAYHIHCAVRGRLCYNLVRSIWRSVVGTYDGKPNGNIDVRNPSKWRFKNNRLACYIAKYIGKDADAATLNKKRYWSSKGIPAPDVDYFSVPNDAGEMLRIAFGLVPNKVGMMAHFDHSSGRLWMNYDASGGGSAP